MLKTTHLHIGQYQEEFKDTKGVIRSSKSKNRQHNGQNIKDTKGVIKSRKSKNRQHNGLKFEDIKGVIRIRKLKDRQHNKTKDRATETTGEKNVMNSRRVNSSWYDRDNPHVALVKMSWRTRVHTRISKMWCRSWADI
jgi:hypothetical protein